MPRWDSWAGDAVVGRGGVVVLVVDAVEVVKVLVVVVVVLVVVRFFWS